MSGYIEVFTGPMFAGKSTKLLGTYLRSPENDRVLISPEKDTRSVEVITHDGQRHPCKKVGSAQELISLKERYIFIDEAQFFGQDLVAVCAMLAKRDHVVRIAGLCTDYKDAPFGPLPELMLEAEIVHKLWARCAECGSSFANKTRRKVDKVGQILVGGSEEYMPVCRSCA